MCTVCATHSIIDIVLLIKISANIIFMHSLGRGALVTSSFDVIKTRLQSKMLHQRHAGIGTVVGDSVVLLWRLGGLLWCFVETACIIWLRPISFPSCIILIYILCVEPMTHALLY